MWQKQGTTRDDLGSHGVYSGKTHVACPIRKATSHPSKRVCGLMTSHECYLLPSPCFRDVFLAHLSSTLVYNIFSALKRNSLSLWQIQLRTHRTQSFSCIWAESPCLCDPLFSSSLPVPLQIIISWGLSRGEGCPRSMQAAG